MIHSLDSPWQTWSTTQRQRRRTSYYLIWMFSVKSVKEAQQLLTSHYESLSDFLKSAIQDQLEVGDLAMLFRGVITVMNILCHPPHFSGTSMVFRYFIECFNVLYWQARIYDFYLNVFSSNIRCAYASFHLSDTF